MAEDERSLRDALIVNAFSPPTPKNPGTLEQLCFSIVLFFLINK